MNLSKKQVVAILLALVALSQMLLIYNFTIADEGSRLISEEVLTRFSPYLPQIFTKVQLPFMTSDGRLDRSFFTFKHHKNVTTEELIKQNKAVYALVLEAKIGEPKTEGLVRAANEGGVKVDNGADSGLANATLFSLVRNKELNEILPSIRQIEDKFNHKFHYPWSFLNDEEFTEEFKLLVRKETKSECFFEKIPAELWKKPEFIDSEKQQRGVKLLKDKGIQYADKESYRNMCRFNSGNFYNTPLMSQFKWYWRVEPKTRYFCDIDYDVFKFMESEGKTYGFVIALYDKAETVETLWNTTLQFLEQKPHYLHPKGAYNWILEDMTNPERNKLTQGYSTCHFWSNFEIANLDFFRGREYSEWFEHLDKSGGFYYERYGDAPVHSLGLSLFEDRSKIHFFRDIGYFHFPYNNCPNSDKCGGCKVGQFSPEGDHLDAENCLALWVRYEMDDELMGMYGV